MTIAFAAFALAGSPAPLVQGLDHVPLAVRDLDQAERDFERLGFVLKPGRAHNDGIRNAHAKFADHTEIELITAENPTDRLAREYVDWLKGGDGPAFWSLYAPDLQALDHALAAKNLSPTNDGDLVNFPQDRIPHRLFFADRLVSPTDRPEYFAHPNTAFHLQGVWLSAGGAERRLLVQLGAKSGGRPNCAPFGRAKATLKLQDGEINLLPEAAAHPPERAIVGVTVLVHSLATARGVLSANGVRYRVESACGRSSVWVGPAEAHSLWIEFRQADDESGQSR